MCIESRPILVWDTMQFCIGELLGISPDTPDLWQV